MAYYADAVLNNNRRRILVRGRVIVNTTSSIVEFMDESLKDSVSLYSFHNMQVGKVAVFMVEVNGYLTFDADSFVKLSDELGPFKQFYFDPLAYTLVARVEPYPGIINNPQILTDAFGPVIGTTKQTRKVLVTVEIGVNLIKGFVFEVPEYTTPTDLTNRARAMFVGGAPWKGTRAYPGFTPTHF
jgi:hypothetical protein